MCEHVSVHQKPQTDNGMLHLQKTRLVQLGSVLDIGIVCLWSATLTTTTEGVPASFTSLSKLLENFLAVLTDPGCCLFATKMCGLLHEVVICASDLFLIQLPTKWVQLPTRHLWLSAKQLDWLFGLAAWCQSMVVF